MINVDDLGVEGARAQYMQWCAAGAVSPVHIEAGRRQLGATVTEGLQFILAPGPLANPLGQPIGTLTANVLGTKAGVALLAINFFSQFGCGVAFVRLLSLFALPVC